MWIQVPKGHGGREGFGAVWGGCKEGGCREVIWSGSQICSGVVTGVPLGRVEFSCRFEEAEGFHGVWVNLSD